MSPPRSYSLAELVDATGFDRRTIVYYIQSGLLPRVGRRGPHTRYPDECLTRLLFIKGVKSLQARGQLLTATLAEIRRALGARDATGIQQLLDRDLPVDEVTALFTEEPLLQAAPPRQAEPARPVEPIRGPAGERRSYGLADAAIRRRPATERPAEGVTPEIHHEETHPGLPALNLATFQPADSEPGASVPASGRTAPPPEAPTVAPSESGAPDPDLGQLLRELEVRPTLNARRSPPGAPEQWTEIPITSRVYLSVRGLSEDDAPLAEAVGRLLKRALRGRPSPGTG